MVSKVAVVLCFMLAAAAAVPAGGWGAGVGGWGAEGSGWGAVGGGWGGAPSANPWIPPWIASAPWFPQWTPCTTIGSTCMDCNTKLVCTKVGGLQRACTDPTKPYCNAGECSETPTAECAPPAETTPEAV